MILINAHHVIFVTLVLFGLTQAGPINHHAGHHHRSSQEASTQNCDHARHQFQQYQIHHKDSAKKPMAGICSGTCCQGLELAIEHKTREQFRAAMNKHISTFRSQFKEHSLTVKNRVFSILDDTVQKVRASGQARNMQRSVSAVELIFDGIRNSLVQFEQYRGNKQQSSLDLEEASSVFIKAIIIDILEKDFGKNFPKEFLDCLNQINFDFSNIEKLTEKMHRSLHFAYETASIVFQSVGHFESLLNRSSGVQLTEKCVRQLAGDLHCGSCEHSNTKQITVCGSTCRRALQTGECLNSGVLPWIGDSWKKMIETFKQFIVLGFLDERNPENSFAEFASVAAKAIYEAHDIKEDIKNKAKLACGNPSRSYRSVNHGSAIASQMPEPESIRSSTGALSSSSASLPASSQASSGVERRSEQLVQFGQDLKPSLFVSVESLSHILAANKNLFANLTDKICLEFGDKHCSHHAPTPSDSLPSKTSEERNPQRQSGSNKDDEYYDVITRFQNALEKHHKKISNSTTYSMIHEGEESSQHFITDGSGSGSNPVDDDSDDDDWELPEGSGDYPEPNPDVPTSSSTAAPNHDLEFDKTDETPVDGDNDSSTGGGAANIRASFIVILVSLLLVVLFERRHC